MLLLFLALGAVSILYARELAACRGVSFGLVLALALFWLWRAAWQVAYFKGGWMHYALIAWFLLLSDCCAARRRAGSAISNL